MTPDDFQKFKAEFEADATTMAKVLLAFAEKWKKREDESQLLTPEQHKEMESVAIAIDKAMEGLE